MKGVPLLARDEIIWGYSGDLAKGMRETLVTADAKVL